ncbi:hypothetical protein F2P81_010558 [Scophthalmus maximus]|uniref:Uncharacterized protein n=1 Tax=Scophthalmus maximus TaxID=52904 RepID=A0A6A4T378_SCOMX|nr:hypothetical protein F2P81_010558 [Scophthalmus maximus]
MKQCSESLRKIFTKRKESKTGLKSVGLTEAECPAADAVRSFLIMLVSLSPDCRGGLPARRFKIKLKPVNVSRSV